MWGDIATSSRIPPGAGGDTWESLCDQIPSALRLWTDAFPVFTRENGVSASRILASIF